MAPYIDPHLQASEEPQSRSPHHGDEPPQSFRNLQLSVALALVAVLVLGWIAYLFLR